MNIKFINADILTMDDQNPTIRGGCLVIKDKAIEYCGKTDLNGKFDRVIDCKGDILMPALFNCHSHLAMSLFRGTAENKNLNDWLYDLIFPMEKNLKEEDVYFGTMLSIAESVRGGVATLCDSYFFNEQSAEAAKISGVNMVLMGADMDLNQSTDAVMEKIQSDYRKYNNVSGNISYIAGCHSVYTCSIELLEAIADFSAQKKCKTYIHLSETLKEVGDCTEKYDGLTPPQLLHKIGYFDNGGIAAHLVYADKDDIQLLKQCGVSAVICSGSNLKLASGIAPVYSMQQNNLNITLGSDGAASNNRLDIFREMYLVSALQKGVLNNAQAISSKEVLKMATVNAVKALGLSNCGMIKKGYSADIIRISVNQPHFYPKNSDIESAIIYNMLSSDVVMTMCRGKVLYENGEYFIGENIDCIYTKCNQSINRLINNI